MFSCFGLFEEYSTLFSSLILFTLAVGCVAVVFAVTGWERPVGYGRHDNTKEEKWRLPSRVAWLLMEAPASIVFLYFFFAGPLKVSPVGLALCALWLLHYIHRAFIYPFHIQVRKGAAMPVSIFAPAMLYCTINGYLNGTNISVYGEHLQASEWFLTPQFIIGTAIFFLGFYWNKHADYTLIRLRKENPNGYTIPQGGMYKYVTSPNYLGEVVTWIGYAIASWTIAGAVFAVFTFMNLLVRAIDNHNWYLEKFPDYPKDRKRLIPFIL